MQRAECWGKTAINKPRLIRGAPRHKPGQAKKYSVDFQRLTQIRKNTFQSPPTFFGPNWSVIGNGNEANDIKEYVGCPLGRVIGNLIYRVVIRLNNFLTGSKRFLIRQGD